MLILIAKNAVYAKNEKNKQKKLIKPDESAFNKH